MRRLVIDAESLLSWFGDAGHRPALRSEYEAGQLTLVAPRTIVGDAIAALARRPGWPAERLERAAVELGRIGLELRDPPLPELARYVANGLPAGRAAYPALAASLDVRLVTDDGQLRAAAAPLVLGD